MLFFVKIETMFKDKTAAVIRNYLKYHKTKLSIGIIVGEEKYILSYGDKKQCEVNDDLFDIGSLSKIFTSLLVLKECSQRKVSLDDNISKYLSLKEGHYWTIGDLLRHKCDFHHLTPYQIVLKSLLRSGYSRRNLYEGITKERLIKEINRRAKHISKRKYGYSDFATAILGLVLQEVNQSPFSTQMDSFIKEEFDLNHTKCINEEMVRTESSIKEHTISPWKWEKNNPYIAGGGMASTIKDMVAFMEQLIIRKDDDFIKKSFATTEEEIEHNLTYFLSKRKKSFWHVGGAGTFRSSMIINPNRQIGVIVLGNQVGRLNGNVHYLAKMIYTDIRRHKLQMDSVRH